jgi:hypothetical protein
MGGGAYDNSLVELALSDLDGKYLLGISSV